MQPATIGPVRACFSLISLLLVLPFATPVSADPADSNYQGWVFETAIFTGGAFNEEQCFGQLDILFAADLNWIIGSTDEVVVLVDSVVVVVVAGGTVEVIVVVGSAVEVVMS